MNRIDIYCLKDNLSIQNKHEEKKKPHRKRKKGSRVMEKKNADKI